MLYFWLLNMAGMGRWRGDLMRKKFKAVDGLTAGLGLAVPPWVWGRLCICGLLAV